MRRKKSQTGASELQGDVKVTGVSKAQGNVSPTNVSELQESVTGVSEAQGNVNASEIFNARGSATGVSKAPADAEPEPAGETLHGEVVGLEDNSMLKVQATSADSDKVSDAIDEGRKLEEGNKKLERRLRLQKLCMAALFALILILLLKSCQSQPEEGKGKPNLETGEYVDTQPDAPHIDGYTAIPVIDDFEVSKSQPYASLYNRQIAYYDIPVFPVLKLTVQDIFRL